jgi:hypothetical protein
LLIPLQRWDFLFIFVTMKSKKPKIITEKRKYERIFDYPDCQVIWKYDENKTNSGPFEVEIKYPKKKG